MNPDAVRPEPSRQDEVDGEAERIEIAYEVQLLRRTLRGDPRFALHARRRADRVDASPPGRADRRSERTRGHRVVGAAHGTWRGGHGRQAREFRCAQRTWTLAACGEVPWPGVPAHYLWARVRRARESRTIAVARALGEAVAGAPRVRARH